jgi:hypothetical protein
VRSKSSFANSITVATFLLMLLFAPLFVFAQVPHGPIMGGPRLPWRTARGPSNSALSPTMYPIRCIRPRA